MINDGSGNMLDSSGYSLGPAEGTETDDAGTQNAQNAMTELSNDLF